MRERQASQRPMLGICLGAQLIARALEARVKPMGVKEIGFAPLSLTPAGHASPLSTIVTQPVLQWHGDQFDLPSGVATLASTPTCADQAFMAGQHTMAWQFHLDVNARRIEQWLIGHAAELTQAQIPPQRLRDQARAHGPALQGALERVLASWLASMPA